ncbi:CDP-alcohol phosphatidyltransferase family protein [Euzebya tangerina]|uniref:CDP-alcohol phosphatidyltransferase family protein n=1 Tax=Euzebya tangerina TaxID=591198 RepID=UPI000E310DFE|nr:CDP-alcohol phosphatidyltransferase family protein [Euzebya tangerina]
MVGPVALALALVVLVIVAVVTAERPTVVVPDREGYFDKWQPLHGGVDPRANPWLRGWLALGYRVARPLAVWGVKPDVLTFTSTWIALAAIVVATYGGRWEILAGWLIVFSGLGDTLDGAVAVATDRTTTWGYVLDSAVDRLNDVLYLVAVWIVGGPLWIVVVAGVAFFMLEYVRARGRNAGGSEVGTVTVGERALRVICCSIAVHWGGVFLSIDEFIATLLISILAVLSVIGLAQIILAVRRDLQALDRAQAAALSDEAAANSGRADLSGDDLG